MADVDECSTEALNKCNQNCRNTKGGFSCSCITGYSLLADKHTCQGKVKQQATLLQT